MLAGKLTSRKLNPCGRSKVARGSVQILTVSPFKRSSDASLPPQLQMWRRSALGALRRSPALSAPLRRASQASGSSFARGARRKRSNPPLQSLEMLKNRLLPLH